MAGNMLLCLSMFTMCSTCLGGLSLYCGFSPITGGPGMFFLVSCYFSNCLISGRQLFWLFTLLFFFLHHHQMVPACETFMATHMNQQPRGKEKRDVQKAECGKTAEVYIEKVGGSKSLGLLCNYPLN